MSEKFFSKLVKNHPVTADVVQRLVSGVIQQEHYFGGFNHSLLEVYGLLVGGVDDFFAHIRKRDGYNIDDVQDTLIYIARLALSAAIALEKSHRSDPPGF